MSSNDNWLAAEAKFKNQQNVIDQAQISVNSAYLSYQETSPIIYAPISGTVTGFSYQVGSVITAQSNSSGTSASQKIASIKTKASPTMTVNMTQIDVPKIKIGNKVTVTLDAFSGKTFTGKVISIDSVGAVSSGVTTYPTVILLDTDSADILTNMTGQANIITDVKDEALLVPVSAIKTQTDGTSSVQIMKNGVPTTVTVEAGVSSDTQTEILSGVSEGDTIVTSTVSTGAKTTSSTSSPFSLFGNNRGGGGAVRAVGR
jgi:HlyD family secretion protein